MHRGCERLAILGDDAEPGPDSLLGAFDGAPPLALVGNYRQHPRLAEFASAHFYGGAGPSPVDPAARPPVRGVPWPRAAVPSCFLECGSDGERSVESSYGNAREAARAAALVCAALAADPALDVACVAPYKAQCRDLKRRLAATSAVVGPVDALRGRAFDLVVFSATRSNRRGAPGRADDGDAARVVLGSAARGLVVLGSARALRRAPVWQQWLAWAEARDLVVDGAKWRAALDRARASTDDARLARNIDALAASAPDGAPVAPATFNRFVKGAIGLKRTAEADQLRRAILDADWGVDDRAKRARR